MYNPETKYDSPRELTDDPPVECSPRITDLMAAGIAHHTDGRFASAVECYSGVLATLPDSGEAWRLLGVIAIQTGDSRSARSLLERAVRLDNNDAAAHSALGNVAESEGDLDAAYAAYEAAHVLDPMQPAASVGRVRLSFARARPRDAIAIGEAALAGAVRDAVLFRALGAARLD